MEKPLLEVEAVSVRFGGVAALSNVSLAVRKGSIHGLIGPNGAGKTTLLNCITRVVTVASGRISFDDRDVLHFAPHAITQLGIARTFQNFGLIGDQTVLDNVLAGMHSVNPISIVDEVFRPLRRRTLESALREQALSVLMEFGLASDAQRTVSTLPYGIRKTVELARAVAIRPKLLLLDEPTAGLSGPEMDGLRHTLLALRDRIGVAMLVISHHLEFLLGAVDEITALDLGERIASGSPQVVKDDPRVIAAYIGETV